MIDINQKLILSVGIDIGTTTSHLVFSELLLKKDKNSRTEKFHVAERKIKYLGKIFFTPLKDGNKEIDTDKLVPLLLNEYKNAGVDVNDVDTGAVICTGESARKENADIIVEKLSKEGGKFVSATAGPNFESIISAFGAGAVQYSKNESINLIHTDIGGGTANIAVVNGGKIVATACINVGGRLFAFDDKNKIIRLENAGKQVLDKLNYSYNLGDEITEEHKNEIAKSLTISLFEAITDENHSDLTKKLMMTDFLPKDVFQKDVVYSFSGGVAEYIYNKDPNEYKDLGLRLGTCILEIMKEHSLTKVEVPQKIRATVLGASEYTLQVSGSTTYMSPDIDLPIRNLPIVVPHIERDLLSVDYVASQIVSALKRMDITEGSLPIALAFHDPVRTVYDKLKTFSEGLVKALPTTVTNKLPIILVFDTDIGNSVGNVLFRETGISNVLSVDEISLKEGDFIDIGEPIVQDIVFPVVVKSLVFNS